MRGDVLEGLRRALKALGRSLVVGAAPTTASFDGSAGVVVVAGDLYRGPAARESRARSRGRIGYVGLAPRAGRSRRSSSARRRDVAYALIVV